MQISIEIMLSTISGANMAVYVMWHFSRRCLADTFIITRFSAFSSKLIYT